MPLIKMEQYTLQQRIEIVKIHYKNFGNEALAAVSVNGLRYRTMINEFL